MRTLFLGARYKVQHKDITPENVTEMLKDDLRSKLMGGHPQSWIYPSNLCIPGTDIKYVGGFYYEPGDGGQYSIVNSEMDEIDRADIVCLDFTKPNAIATIAELFYALKKDLPTIFLDRFLLSLNWHLTFLILLRSFQFDLQSPVCLLSNQESVQ